MSTHQAFSPLPETLRTQVCAIAREAGVIIMRHYQGSRRAKAKADRSPVTEADVAANSYIVEKLTTLTPDIPVISEEDASTHSFTTAPRFWLVDPLDGTIAYVRGDGEFSVNIGLVEDGRAVYGVIYLPVPATLYHGGKELGAWRETTPITTRAIPEAGMTVIRSRSFPSYRVRDFLAQYAVHETLSASSALKFCRIAEGQADLYPRLGRTMEWDTAAGQAIIEAAGGRVETEDGQLLTYGKPGYENPGFVVFGTGS